jgi:hypothetical protein
VARADEAAKIRQANRAAAVGRLLLGEFQDWSKFLSVETDDLEALPRRMLKAGKVDVQKRLSEEIRKFCKQNDVLPCNVPDFKLGSVPLKKETDNEAQQIFRRTDHRHLEGASGRDVCR